MSTDTPKGVRSTGQIDDNQDDLGRDVNDKSKKSGKGGQPGKRPARERNDKESLSGDAIHDGSQH